MKKSAKNTAHATEFKSWRLHDIWKIRAEMVYWSVDLQMLTSDFFYFFSYLAQYLFENKLRFFVEKIAFELTYLWNERETKKSLTSFWRPELGGFIGQVSKELSH